MSHPYTEREALLQAGRDLYRRGMLAGTDGNLSLRLTDATILVTPSGLPKGRLEAEDLVVVDAEGRHLDGHREASSELPMHLFVYDKRPEIRACVHSHAPHATALAVAGIMPPDDVLPEVVLFVGEIPLTRYAPPGTGAVAQSLEPFIARHEAFLLKNHGLLTIGATLEEAMNRHETVEHYAHILLHARALGRADSIPADDRARLEKLRLNAAGKKYHGR
jgi:L-fuculose-phosphate aldolase